MYQAEPCKVSEFDANQRLDRQASIGVSLGTSGCRIVNQLHEAVASWRLVYRVYLESGLIEPNPFGIHTCPQMINSQSLIAQKLVNGHLVATLSALADGMQGLPLDAVFHTELELLRRDGRKLMEVGQFAHDRDVRKVMDLPITSDRAVDDPRLELRLAQTALTIMTGYTFQYGLGMGVTDLVIGVHPRHSRFYMRSWGFVPCSSERVYPMVNNRPVVLMRLDWRSQFMSSEQPYAMQYAAEHPLPGEVFARRYNFDLAELRQADVRVLDYLMEKYGQLEQAA